MTNQNMMLRFLIIWLGDFISTIGSGLTAFALGVYAFKLTGHAADSAMVVLCTFLPAFVLRPIGGVLADRLDRRLLMIAGNMGSALGMGLTFFLIQYNPNNLLLIYPGIIISSMFYALQNPAYKACVSDYLTPELYAKASGLLQLSSAAQFLIAPILGGLLMSFLPVNYVLLIDLMTFVVSAVAVICVRSRTHPPREKLSPSKLDFGQEMLTGLKVIITDKGILSLVCIVSLLLFYIGLIQTLLTPMVLSFTTTRMLGIAQSICGCGMLCTSVFISIVSRKINNVLLLTLSLAFMGVFFAFIGINANIWAVIIPGFLFFGVIPFANSSIDVLIRHNIGNDTQGRVWSLISVFTYLGSMLAYAISGFLADRVFNPLLVSGGTFATQLGMVFGVGPGRGIALMFFIAGMLVIVLALFVYNSEAIWSLEKRKFENAIIPPKEESLAV